MSLLWLIVADQLILNLEGFWCQKGHCLPLNEKTNKKQNKNKNKKQTKQNKKPLQTKTRSHHYCVFVTVLLLQLAYLRVCLMLIDDNDDLFVTICMAYYADHINGRQKIR